MCPIQDLSLEESNDDEDDSCSIVSNRSIRSALRPETFKFLRLHISFNSETLSDESDDFLCLHSYDLANKRSNPIYYAIVFMIKYKDGLILTQESVRELLDHDPCEGQDWNWEDYE